MSRKRQRPATTEGQLTIDVAHLLLAKLRARSRELETERIRVGTLIVALERFINQQRPAVPTPADVGAALQRSSGEEGNGEETQPR